MIKALLLGASASVLSLTASAEIIAVTGGKVWTGSTAGTIENGVVVIDDGDITAVGPVADVNVPSVARVIDADGQWVTPGIIAPFSRVGISEVGAEDSTNDAAAATTPYSAALRASDGFNPAATSVDITRIEGVTRLVIAPGSAGTKVFAGQGFVADTSGEADSITDDRTFLFVTMGESGAAAAGGSRAAAWAQLRAGLSDARSYPSRFIAHNEGDAVTRLDAQALGPASRGQQLILIQAHRASDLRAIVDFAEENAFLNIAIVGADEGWLVAEDLAGAGIPVIVDPFQNLPASFEQLGATMKNAERLIEAGVITAFAHLGDSSHQSRLILQVAGNAVANGVDHDDAMEAITAAPAAIFGMETLGSLEPGKVGDLVIWDGDPLEVTSSPVAVIINGEETSLESRQTKLRDRYMDLEGEEPFAYRRP